MNYNTSLRFFCAKNCLNFIYLRYITMPKWFCQHFGRYVRGFYTGFYWYFLKISQKIIKILIIFTLIQFYF